MCPHLINAQTKEITTSRSDSTGNRKQEIRNRKLNLRFLISCFLFPVSCFRSTTALFVAGTLGLIVAEVDLAGVPLLFAEEVELAARDGAALHLEDDHDVLVHADVLALEGEV